MNNDIQKTTYYSNNTASITNVNSSAPKEKPVRELAFDREELVEQLIEESVNAMQDGIDSGEDARTVAKRVMDCVATVLEEMGLTYKKDKKELTKVSTTPPSPKATRQAIYEKMHDHKRQFTYDRKTKPSTP